MKPIPYGTQFIDDDDINAVIETLKSDFMTQGPKVPEFEQAVADYHNCRYAVAFSNGTAALHAAYYVSGIGVNNEFITSNNTFAASANAGLYCGASPVLCDIDKDSYNIDFNKIWDKVSNRTKVITPVSYAGNPVDLKSLYEKAIKEDIIIIHDAAHAIGAKINNNNICDFAHMTMVSFHPVKHVATGEGGIILTNDDKYYKKLKLFRSHGITKDSADFENAGNAPPWYYEMQELGYNYRLTDLQSALGISQMKKLNSSLYKRNIIAGIYDKELDCPDFITIPENPFDKTVLKENTVNKAENLHSYHLYPILLDKRIDRSDFFNYLRRNDILVQVHYIPINYMPYYRNNFGCKKGDFPVSEDFYEREISLPMFPSLTQSQQEYVIETIKNYKRAKINNNG